QDDVLYATNVSGAWVHTFLYEENTEFDFGHALDMASALDEDGKIHIVHRRYNDYSTAHDSDLNLSTNEAGEWMRKRLIKGSLLVFSPAVIGEDDRIHIVFRRDGSERLVYGMLDGSDWNEETLELITIKGSITDEAIALSNEGIPHVVYGTSSGENFEIDKLRYAVRDSRGWNISTIADSAEYYTRPKIAFDSAGTLHITYSVTYSELGSFEAEYGTKTSQWAFESIPDVGSAYSLAIDLDDRPVIGYRMQLEFTEETRLGRRLSPENWEEDVVLSTQGQAGAADILIRNDGTVDLISAVGDDANLPDGRYFASNAGGPWELEPLNISGPGAFTRDSGNRIHYALWATSGDPALDPVGIYYVTNFHGDWERYLITIYTYDGDLNVISIHQRSDGNLTLLHDYTGQALMAATFEPGME
ncbi:MAG: hypothetical protein IT350_06280, partial [Deltaproteobacteria bacterium]|nr:hypothetical protein [Deltaproteobacteria bacterium]